MNILNESILRATLMNGHASQYCVETGTFVTPLAREYLRDRGIELVFRDGGEGMPQTPIPDKGSKTYIDAQSGEGLEKKPERMTHLFANQLAPKTHPRIALRGKLDTLQGEIIAAQVEADADGRSELTEDLGEILVLTREILGAEVTGRALKPLTLLGYNSDELRYVSHHVKEYFGFPHPIPDYSMGRFASVLNLLRTRVREVEITAENTFPTGESEDILLALNRLSSAVYILFCRLLAGQYGR
ncbi:MAG: cobalamin adenosyltransferase [Synergistaceae bacterium]|jgi:ethanolamine utilization cobalamin adenosyltransferase|nr:cobalamin adenosyltransferase [Synergistaceae bacterium]